MEKDDQFTRQNIAIQREMKFLNPNVKKLNPTLPKLKENLDKQHLKEEE